MAAYCALFLGCYALQYEPWKIGWLDSVMGMSFPTILTQAYSPVIAVMAALLPGAAIVLAVMLKKRPTKNLCIGASVYAVCAFVADRLVKGFAPAAEASRLSRIDGADGVIMAGYHANAVRFLDMLLLPLFAVSLTLMVCVCYNKRVILIRKENYNG